MNLKYYLRGLGLGILVTAVVMAVSSGGRKESLSDEEIMARARELGMTESTVLSDYAEKTADAKQPEEEGDRPENDEKSESGADQPQDNKQTENGIKTQTDKPAQGEEQPENSIQETQNGLPKENLKEENVETPSAVENQTASKPADDSGTSIPERISTAEPAVFIINRGDGSYTVSERLEHAGLVSSAIDFDHFLVENGYDKKIVAGEHMIPTDADEKMIADIITGQE